MRNWRGPLILGAVVALAVGWALVALIPFALMNVAIGRLAAQGGMNTMYHGALATPERQPVVRPSPDLAYSSCPYDLSDGPLLISVIPVPGRYSSLSVFDARTDVIFVRNDQQASERPYRLAVAREGQKVPPGIETIRVGYDRGIALIRLLLADKAELASLAGQRQRTECRSLGKS